jgi:hypothetical protein
MKASCEGSWLFTYDYQTGALLGSMSIGCRRATQAPIESNANFILPGGVYWYFMCFAALQLNCATSTNIRIFHK